MRLPSIAHHMKMPISSATISLLFLFLYICAVSYVDLEIGIRDAKGEDIYYSWVEGKRITSGENPYARISDGDMRKNSKYATYFPLFYLLSASTQVFGFDDYSEWIILWKCIFLVFHIGTGIVLFLILRSVSLSFAAFSSIFWGLNRWNINLIQIHHLDFLPIFFLLLSLILFEKERWMSVMLLSISLALKQIGIFVVPLYLIRVVSNSRADRWKNGLKATAMVGSIPLLTSIPFLLKDYRSFLKSLLFSMTRLPHDHFGTPSVDALLGYAGIGAKIFMLLLFALIYFTSYKNKIGWYTAAFLVMATFVSFNSVLFRQYMCWMISLILLIPLDFQSVQAKSSKEFLSES